LSLGEDPLKQVAVLVDEKTDKAVEGSSLSEPTTPEPTTPESDSRMQIVMENEQFGLIDAIEEMAIHKDISLKPMRLAADIMNADVKTLSLDHTVNQCLKFMEARRVRHVPVVDLQSEAETWPCFIGVISQRDVLRLNAPDAEKSSKQKTDKRALRQLLAQIVARKPESVSLETPIQDVITVMLRNHIDMATVLDDGDLVGIVTTTDLMRFLLKLDKVVRQLCQDSKKGALPADRASEVLFSWLSRTVQDIMTEDVISLTPQDNLARAIEVLQAEKLRHILVTDEQGEFVGLVSDRDILRNLPFAGRRPLSRPKKFREHLFAVKPRTKSLELTLEEIMVRKALCILPSSSLSNAADVLRKKKISCLPVIDKSKKLRGIVTVTNLMRALLTAYESPEKSVEPAGV